jgi:hypothetical protein
MSKYTKRDNLEVSKKRWAAYVAAGAAATLAGTQTAEADITHVVVGGTDGAITFGVGSKGWALDGSAQLIFGNVAIGGGTTRGLAFAGFNTNASLNFGNMAGTVVNGYNYVANMSFDANVSTAAFLAGAGGTMAYGNGYGGDKFLNNTGTPSTGYAGFRFDTNAGGTNFQFGWARVTLNGDTPLNTFVVEEYAYGDVGDSIKVGEIGAIPEPGSLGCLALGAIGLLASRRRRKAS